MTNKTVSTDRIDLDPQTELLPGVRWGHPTWVPSPAFWHALAGSAEESRDDYMSPPGTPLQEQLAFCMLGGFGIKMEMNRAGWIALQAHGLLAESRLPRADEIETVLSNHVFLDGRRVRYRFARQKAARLSQAMRTIEHSPPPAESVDSFRRALMAITGIGPKTASWLARNWLRSEKVAILDVHVVRAGQVMGLFGPKIALPKQYFEMEARFLDFASALNVRPSLLDAIIWRQMRVLGAGHI